MSIPIYNKEYCYEISRLIEKFCKDRNLKFIKNYKDGNFIYNPEGVVGFIANSNTDFQNLFEYLKLNTDKNIYILKNIYDIDIINNKSIIYFPYLIYKE